MHRLAFLVALAVTSFSACSSGSSAASVAPDPIVSVSVEPPDLLLLINDEGSLDATARTQRGRASSKPVTWTSSDSLVARVDADGNVRGIRHGSAVVVAEVDGVVDSAAVEIRTPPPPPPASGLHFRGDFSAVLDDAELGALVDLRTPANIHAQRGVGMRYDFIARPDHCNDHTLASVVDLPTGTKEVWIRFRIRFSGNWTTVNPNCSSGAPGYKNVITWLDKKPFEGEGRFDLKQRPDRLDGTPPGWATAQVVPFTVVRGSGVRSDELLWDDRWHRVEMHQELIGDDEALVQIRIDGQITHNYRTTTTRGLISRWLTRINIGANRNLGATQLMRIWWDDLEIFVGDDPGGFDFPNPTVY
ncbi:MAG: Ig-like domain-containing protein [Gemmatimonadota bacterium]|nr:Ig-like domain-containing protein [Gemmatimonadota bacterium]